MLHCSTAPVHRLSPFPLLAVLLVCLTLSVTTVAAAEQKDRSNFVVILVDDLGYMDIGAYNPQTFYETPNVDRLAKSGMKFTNGYAANPVCSPTRYSIMTGKYPSRVDATDWFTGKREGRFRPAPLNDVMPLEEVTLAEALDTRGYHTAFVGKWHLGPTEEYWPEQQGFEINIGGHSKGSPPGGYFAPYTNPRLPSGPKGEFLTERLTDESLKIIEQWKAEPFLLYLAFYTVHTPLQAPPELVKKYEQKAARLGLKDGPQFADEEQVLPIDRPRKVRIVQNHATYAAMVESMDTAVGRVLDKLDALGISDNTVVCFTSDNGGLSTAEGSPTSNLPLRGGKGWVYEGGIREPFIVRAPGMTTPGTTSDVPVMSMDFYPTILDLAGASQAAGETVDGVSLVPLLKQTGELDRDALFWHYPHYSNQGGPPGGAVRMGDYKLVERYEDGRTHLYNLRDDVGEQHDLAEAQPDRANTMRDRLHDWYETVDAKFLRAKPDGPTPWHP